MYYHHEYFPMMALVYYLTFSFTCASMLHDFRNSSGLAVVPNPNELGGGGSAGSSASAPRDMVFGLAQEASSGDGDGNEEQVRRTITMVTREYRKIYLVF